jgi:UDP-N-acetylmuramate dehydrogenase
MDKKSDFMTKELGALRKELLARYTSARIGGPAEWLIVAETVESLVKAVQAAQAQGLAWHVLGSGSNVLAADSGVGGLVIINRARSVMFKNDGRVYAEAGANLSSLARNCITRGLAGLEWAVNVPGTVGGAVVGNAGAHGGDVARSLESATILEQDGAVKEWPLERFDYGYRDSVLKRGAFSDGKPVVLAAVFALEPGDPDVLSRRANGFAARRKATQPPGASIGSMFKNPPGDYAGRLIEAAGLKGVRVGGAQISPVHANFFVNLGGATATDVKALIDLAQKEVQQRFGVGLELEIELFGKW